MKRMMAVILSLVVAISLLSGCGEKADTGTFKIGMTGPLTGGAALYGIAVKRGAEIAVAEINAKGGIQFELRAEDDTHDAEKAVNAYNSLIDWGMQISLGSVTSTPCEATAAIAAKEKIFALTPSASNPTVTKAGKGYQFQLCFSDPNQGSASAVYIKNQNLASKVAVIYKNDEDYSTSIYESFKTKAAEIGLQIVSETTFNADTSTDFSVQVAAAKSAGAELIFLPMYYEPASQILAECDKIGYKPAFFGVDGMDGILSMDGFNTALAEGVMLLTPFSADASDEKTKNFVKKYQDQYNETPIQFAADAYDCVYAIYEAIQKSGVKSNMKASEIAAKMVETFTSKSFSFGGVTGTGMTWNAAGEVTKDPKGMKIQNGVYVGLD